MHHDAGLPAGVASLQARAVGIAAREDPRRRLPGDDLNRRRRRGAARSAFPLKPLHALLPDPGQTLGAWLLACYVLQGVFSTRCSYARSQADRPPSGPWRALLSADAGAPLPHRPRRLVRPLRCCSRRSNTPLAPAAELPVAPAGLDAVIGCRGGHAAYLAVMVLGLAAPVRSDALWPRISAAPCRAAGGLALVVTVSNLRLLWLYSVFLVGSSDLEREGLGFYSINCCRRFNEASMSSLLQAPAAHPGNTR